MGYRQYGLRYDDLIDTHDAAEAVRRLPLGLQEERSMRLKRALDLNLKNLRLPQEHWTKEAEDVHYLRPYLNQVHKENLERESFRK